MNKFKTGLITLCAAVALVFSTSNVQAQSDFTDEQIEKFVAINKDTQPLQEEMQQKMMDAVKAEGMTMERVQELGAAMQSGDETMAGASEEEQASFMTIAQAMMSMQQEMMGKYGEAAEKHGLDVTVFQQMAMAYQQDEEFRGRIDEMMGGGEDDSADEADEATEDEE